MTTERLEERTYSSSQLIKTTGVSYRKFDYWCRLGVIIPVSAGGATPGSGYWRSFDDREVAIVAIINKLAEMGCFVPTLRLVACQLREEPLLLSQPMLFISRQGVVMDGPAADGWMVAPDAHE